MMRVFVGTYTKSEPHVDGKADGIYSCDFDSETGELSIVCDPVHTQNPSYVCVHPNGQTLYAANELVEDVCEVATFGAYRVEASGALELINEIQSEGLAPCYVTTDREGKRLYGINYATGSVILAPIREDGGLEEIEQKVQHEGSGPHPGQDGPHAHSIYLDPTESYAVVPDKGADRVFVYSVRSSNGRLKNASGLDLPAGAGPRHFAFHPSGKWAYVINELNSTITSCLWKDGQLVPFETVSTLPEDFDGTNATADIHITPDGRFLYASNRGHDTLMGYHIDATIGALVPIRHTDCGGKVPRGFAIDPTGTWLLCAGQNSDNIITFKIDSTQGTLTPTAELEIPTPVCVKFAPGE